MNYFHFIMCDVPCVSVRFTVGQSPYKSWAWTLWEATVPIPKNKKKLDLVCKAVDSSHNVQPERIEGIWNLRGLLNNSWHRVSVKVEG